MSFVDILLGKPLATSDERAEQIGPVAGIPIFGLDALSSAAYGPEAALTLLIPLGAAGVAYIVPVSASIIVLLAIVYFSYRQTIAAYPGGGGSYTVASENLGTYPGLLAAAALMLDYVLTAAVGISAGVGALVSAVPQLQPHTLAHVPGHPGDRHDRESARRSGSGRVFHDPDVRVSRLAAVRHPDRRHENGFRGGASCSRCRRRLRASLGPATVAVSVWLLLQVFSNGCTAMTGVEAVSNGVRAFREPTVRNAQRTLTVIIALLAILLAGIAYLVRAYGIQATDPGLPGYQSVISMLVAAMAGRGIFYYFTIGSVLVILSLSANTAFADFPRLCKAVAHDGFLPHSFGFRGRRLVYSQGIYVLAVLSGILLIYVSRRNRPADSALRDWRVSRLHAVASGNGGPLAAEPGPRRGSQHARQRAGGRGHGRNARGRARCEIHFGSMGQRVADRRDDGHDDVGAATLHQSRRGNTAVPTPLQFEYLGPPSSSCRFSPGR